MVFGKETKASSCKSKAVFSRKEENLMSFSFCSTYIDAIGYDAQRALLEVRLVRNGRVRRYIDVPEETWYQFRESLSPDNYYRRFICGHFQEMRDCKTVCCRDKLTLDKRK